MAEQAAISQIVDSVWARDQLRSKLNRPVKVAYSVSSVDNELEFVDFNISGTTFTVRRSLLLKYPNSKLGVQDDLKEYWSQEKEAYYFDRSPALFNSILDVFRYNVVTIPAGYSEVMFKRELKFWNISWDELEVGSCIDLDEELEKEFEWMEGRVPPPPSSASVHAKRKYLIWCFLMDPQGQHTRYRKLSTIYVLSNIFLTALYMVLFGISTDSSFRIVHNNVTGEMEPALCQGISECFRKSDPQRWLDLSLFTLRFYFLAETALRLIICPNYKFYLKSIITWLDIIPSACLVVMLPIYLVPRGGQNFDILSPSARLHLSTFGLWMLALQVLRVFKIFQYATLVDGLMVMALTLKASLKELGLLIIYLMMTMFFFSTLVTFVELHSNKGIPNCLIGYWWAIITMTTVGYGDYYPVTPMGYIVGFFCAITGLIMTALPVAVIGNNFHLYWDHNNKRNKIQAGEAANIQRHSITESPKNKQDNY